MSEQVHYGPEVLRSVIQDLVRRPRGWGSRGDRPLPVLHLHVNPHQDPLPGLARWLGTSRPVEVRYALVDADRAAERADERWRKHAEQRRVPVLPLLDEMRHQLTADRFGDRGPSLFRHYRLVDWLTGRSLDQGAHRDRLSDIEDVLRLWHGRWEHPEAARDAAISNVTASHSALVKLLVHALFAWHRPVRYRLWSRGVRLFGRETRWLLRRQFLRPGRSASFPGFAERLTVGRREQEDEKQLKKLLVHAFLQDLRELYGTGRARPRYRRRTAYAVVLLRNATEDNKALELLNLVNEVREESGECDPVLFVAATPTPSPQPGLPLVGRLPQLRDDWYERPRGGRRFAGGGGPPIEVVVPATDDARRGHEPEPEPFRTPPVPLVARRSFLAASLVVALVAAGLTGGRWAADRFLADCLPSPRSGVGVLLVGGECVGYSDDAAQVFGADERVRRAQAAVFEQNGVAERLAGDDPGRPLVTVVYFAEFTGYKQGDPSAGAVTEELTGLLIRQAHDNVTGRGPLLRVVVANGGKHMRHADLVVTDLLGPLLDDDPSVMGVVGMSRTVPRTVAAIRLLGDLGAPVVATTLTGGGVAAGSPLYFQLVPGNAKQAGLLVGLAGAEGRSATVYQPRDLGDDTYLISLRQEMEHAFRGVDDWLRTWGDVSELEVKCGPGHIAYFGGRETDFLDFLRQVHLECAQAGPPMVVGNDTTSRFIADNAMRKVFAGLEDYPGTRSVSFVSLAGEVVLANRGCLSDTGVAADSISPLCSWVRSLVAARSDLPAWNALGALLAEDTFALSWVGERIGVAYDGAGLFVRAVERNRFGRDRPKPGPGDAPYAPNRAAIAQELREFSCSPSPDDCYAGASGRIDFRAGRTGDSRPLYLLRIADIDDLRSRPECAYVFAEGNPPCPR